MTVYGRRNESTSSAGWWETVTAAELRAAQGTITHFLDGDGTATPAQITEFSRAVALQQLLAPETAPFENACGHACHLLESRFRPGAVALPLFEWLPRGRAIEKGLRHCQNLLTLSPETEAKNPPLDHYALLLHLAEMEIGKLRNKTKL